MFVDIVVVFVIVQMPGVVAIMRMVYLGRSLFHIRPDKHGISRDGSCVFCSTTSGNHSMSKLLLTRASSIHVGTIKSSSLRSNFRKIYSS